ncbi:MAG TPA: hypothetical protein VMT53_06170 [Terriglobales bacterium]|nr:hypothetical protein [Terriglobales bacterium]
MKTKRRGVYKTNGKVLVIPWDKGHPCPPEREWVFCSRCDARHPDEGHLYISWNPKSGVAVVAFIPDDLVSDLNRMNWLWRTR